MAPAGLKRFLELVSIPEHLSSPPEGSFCAKDLARDRGISVRMAMDHLSKHEEAGILKSFSVKVGAKPTKYYLPK